MYVIYKQRIKYYKKTKKYEFTKLKIQLNFSTKHVHKEEEFYTAHVMNNIDKSTKKQQLVGITVGICFMVRQWYG